MMAFVLKKPVPTALPQTIFKVSYPSSMLSRSLQRSSPQAISTVLSRPACCLAPSQQGSPQAISTVSSPSSTLSRSLPAKLSASYFHGFLSIQHAVSLPPSDALRNLFARFPLRPARCLAPAQRSSPQAICTVSSPSSMLSRSLPAKLSLTYFHGFLSVQDAVSLPPSKAFRKLFARFSLRPACCLAPSQRSFPQAVSLPPSSASYFHGFLSVQHVISLPPSETLRKLFSHFPPCSMLSPSLPVKLSATYLHGFFSVQHAVSLPPSEAFRKLSRSLPAQQAISTVSYPSSMLSRSLPAKLSASYFHTFLRAACCLPPSQ